MNDLIGAGAILEAGEQSTATPAALHALVRAADRPAVAAIDLDGGTLETLRRLLVVIAGWDARRFERDVVASLRARGEVSLADVFIAAARATGSDAVDVFAPWTPDDVTVASLARSGIAVRVHPPAAVVRAALTAGQRHWRWGTAPAA